MTIGETIEDRQKEINFLNKKLKEYCNQLNVDDVRSLNYSESKKLYLVAGDYLSDDIKKIYEEKRLEEHPELKKAIYFPELNDIDFLTKAKIKKIDTLLGKSWNKKGFFVMNAFYKAANLYGKEREKFDDFVCRKGIFKKIIHLWKLPVLKWFLSRHRQKCVPISLLVKTNIEILFLVIPFKKSPSPFLFL